MEGEIRPRYDILDGLRGVAAVSVLCYHLFEAIAFAAGAPEQDMYHGFLAVDFFFILSGFVMGYAYDEKWNRMSLGGFIKRRLIRLHPMVVIGVILGLIAFCIQGMERWDGSQVSISLVMLSTLLALFMLPSPTSMDVRGNTEAFPLNGPHWSLFFEYIGSLLYGMMLHRFSTRLLKIWVFIAAILLFLNGFLSGDGWIAYGWSSEPHNLSGGLLRMLFGYPAGLLLARLFRERKPQSCSGLAFLLCTLALLLLFLIPNIKGYSLYYQMFCLMIAFPLVIWYGARGCVSGKTKGLVSWLGRLSYPLYAIHYPLIYLYIHWINKDIHPFGSWQGATPISIFIIAILLSSVIMKYYDEPIRKWLTVKYRINK